jgi:WXXGXW repeat (2 copies)
MNAFHVSRMCSVALLAAIGSNLGSGQVITRPESRSDGEDGIQVLTRGPVHEAFAETITFDPEPGIVVGKTPPQPIEELPPEQRPDGENVDWIPGYWGWDDERDDFLWISGVWRALPPGREWVPGYWGRSSQGNQWISGYWADAQSDEIEYLPEPPETVEIGPNLAAPSPDHTWLPGSWVWHERRYAWRPGTWQVVQPNWDWIPAHYVWAPRGYVFVDGYWDHSISRRGVLYAPVYFDASVYARRGFSYSPATVIHASVFGDHLFVRPRYSHYYFGDYYAPSYRDTGFYASFSYHVDRHGYDPIYTHERWRNRQDSEWDRRVQANFSLRRDNEDARPRRTLAAQVSFNNTDARRRDRSLTLASSAEQVSRDGGGDGVRFRRVDKDERQNVVQRGKDVQRFREERQRVESDASSDKTPDRAEPVRIKARRSPIAARSGERLGKDDSPPKRPQAPQPDPKVERKPRKAREKRERPDRP